MSLIYIQLQYSFSLVQSWVKTRRKPNGMFNTTLSPYIYQSVCLFVHPSCENLMECRVPFYLCISACSSDCMYILPYIHPSIHICLYSSGDEFRACYIVGKHIITEVHPSFFKSVFICPDWHLICEPLPLE